MGTRLEFHEVLIGLGDLTAYFDPPSSLLLQFPAIIYNLDAIDMTHADNIAYAKKNRYQTVLVTADPDDPIKDRISDLPLTRYVRHFTTANKHHYIFDVYF